MLALLSIVTMFKKDPDLEDTTGEHNLIDWQKYVRDTKRYIPLHELKERHLEHKSNQGPLANLALFTKARLSVQGLTTEEFNYILELEDQKSDLKLWLVDWTCGATLYSDNWKEIALLTLRHTVY